MENKDVNRSYAMKEDVNRSCEIGGNMRKKISVICAVGIMVTATAASRNYARAESNTIRSYGNLVFGDGSRTAVYSSDIQYLKGELDGLFGEIPND